jgi:hypothetical protein
MSTIEIELEKLQHIIYMNNIDYLRNNKDYEGILTYILDLAGDDDYEKNYIAIKLVKMALNTGNKKIFEYIHMDLMVNDLESFIENSKNSVFLEDAINGKNLRLIKTIYEWLNSDGYTEEILNNCILKLISTDINFSSGQKNNIEIFKYLFYKYKQSYNIDNNIIKLYITQIITQYRANKNYIDGLNILYWFEQIINNYPNEISSSITDDDLLYFIKGEINKFIKNIDYLSCSNSRDYFSLDKFENNQDIVYFIMPNSKKYCFDYDNLIQWFSQHEVHMAHWIPNNIYMDDSGRGGGPDLDFIVHKVPAEYTFYINDDIYYEILRNEEKTFQLYMIHPNLRIGNIEGDFGPSLLHGQIPGVPVYGF